ncbi:gas vesicle protein [Rhodobacterales bacterium HKCCE3408]|nr:gas vesicle protein [Rhodobacterales bacterium HKCCE3408]
MGILSSLLLAPVKLPATGTIWLARKLAQTAEAERNNPAALRATLAEAERLLLAEEMTEDEYDAIETDILTRLKGCGG